MRELIELLTIITTIYVIIVFIAFVYGKEKRRRKRKQYQPTEKELDVLALILTHKEFNKSLNFMLMYGIIDYEEYNKIQSKSLPYLKG